MSGKVLMVDDDLAVLSSYKRVLKKKLDVHVLASAQKALSLLQSSPRGTYAVVIADYGMPEMNGLTFLKKVREISPDTVRVMLTGYTDFDLSIAAINEGHIFRFLTKPCKPSALELAIKASIKQFNLIMAEKELLLGTLKGSVKLLTEVLSMTNPVAWGQSERIKRLVSKILEEYSVPQAWAIEVAAMLSQIGCSAIPISLVEKVNNGKVLSDTEMQLYQNHPQTGSRLLNNIPRLDIVADLIAQQDNLDDESVPIGARIINLAKQYDLFQSRGYTNDDILDRLRQKESFYGNDLLKVFTQIVSHKIETSAIGLSINSLKVGMVVDQDVFTVDNLLLLHKGQELTDATILRLRNYGLSIGVKEPIFIQEEKRLLAVEEELHIK